MKHIALFFKGMLFGIANLIPGVSGGTMAIVTGIYEKLLDSINNLFKKFKLSILFLIVFGLGAVVAVLAGSKVIEWGLKYFELPISFLFIGLILGSFPAIKKPIKNKMKYYHYIIMLIAFLIVIGLLFIPFPDVVEQSLKFYDYLILVVCGFMASIAMVVPGISGMMMFYLFGYYDTIMGAISGLTKIASLGSSILVLIPVGIGVVIGIFTAAKAIAYLLNRFPIATYSGIIGFVVGSIFALIYNGGVIEEIISFIGFSSMKEYFISAATYINGHVLYTWANLLISVLFFFTGLFGSLLLIQLSEKKEKEKEETEKLVNKKREQMKQELIEEINNMNKSNGEAND
jgi:putative membrane protein